MLITSRPRRNTLIDIPNITRTSCIKYLGVYIDEHLQWHNQITHVNSKIAKNIGILFQLRRYLNIHMLTNLYYTLIYPYLSYGLMSWGTTYKSKFYQLSSKLNKCVKCIFFANRHENPSPYYKLLGILKLDNLIKFKTATFVSQIRNRGNEIPELFSELLVPVSSVHSYNTRYASQDNYYRPAARTNYGKFSFKFFASQLWETIPVFLKSLLVILSKRNIKTFYLIIRNNLLLQISSTLFRIFIY
jgi:hypothetical protein